MPALTTSCDVFEPSARFDRSFAFESETACAPPFYIRSVRLGKHRLDAVRNRDDADLFLNLCRSASSSCYCLC
jgi:hypothetical protein